MRVSNRLSQAEANKLAVSLANSECMARFDEAPFRESDFPIVFKDGRWKWGEVDPSGVSGFSARVSFDRAGGDRVVEVFYSSDGARTQFR